MAAPVPASTQPARAQSGNLLSQKWGPLPVWGWLAIVTFIGLLYYFYAKSKANSATATTGTAQIPEQVIQNVMPTQTVPAPGATPPPAPKPEGKDDDDADDKDAKKHPHKRPKKGGGGTGPPTRKTRTVTIARGQTLADVATQAHVPEAQLAQLNGIAHTGHVTPGQKIQVPA